MKYYQNKTTGEIIGVENLRELIDFPTEMSINLGFKGYSRNSIVDVIMPNKILGNGIVSFTMSCSFLSANYKRISFKVAIDRYPEFMPYRFAELQREKEKTGMSGLEILNKQTI